MATIQEEINKLSQENASLRDKIKRIKDEYEAIINKYGGREEILGDNPREEVVSYMNEFDRLFGNKVISNS